MIKLQAQNHAGEEAYQHDDRRRPGSNKVYLLDDEGQLPGPKNHEKRLNQKNKQSAHTVDQTDGYAA